MIEMRRRVAATDVGENLNQCDEAQKTLSLCQTELDGGHHVFKDLVETGLIT